MMSLCHVGDYPKMQMPMQMPGLPSQVYPGHATFEGILEIRKEKSRDAARSRRGKENYEFYELAKMLPLPGAITSQLDKASIIRLTISYLKLKDFSGHGDPPWNRDGPPPNKSVKAGHGRRRSMTAVAMEIFETHQGTHILQSLDGFAFALSNDGRFLYISETVSIYLGLSQVEMAGSSIFDYVHVNDHQELSEQLGFVAPSSSSATNIPSPGSASDEGSSSTNNNTTSSSRAQTPPVPEKGDHYSAIMSPNPSKGSDRTFCIRMKSTLTKRGVHVKCSGYRVVQFITHMRPQFSFSLTRKHPPPLLGLVGIAIALPPPTINELVIDSDMFVTRLSPNFKVIYCEPRIGDLMDITAEDLTNKNLYEYCHAEDLQRVRKSHCDLLTKGQVLTDYYRLMNKHGGYVWIQTCATVICNPKNAEDQNIIAINYVLSGIEYGHCIMDMRQLKVVSPGHEPDQSDNSEHEPTSPREEKRDDSERQCPDGRGRSRQTDRSRGNKRKHSSSQDDCAPLHDIVDDSVSPHNALSLLYQTSVADDSYLDESKNRLDAKNSRRKMERPRKRKKESESDGDGGGSETIADLDNPSSPTLETILNGTADSETQSEPGVVAAAVVSSVGSHQSATNSEVGSPSSASISSKLKSPTTTTAEDLTLKNGNGNPTPTSTPVGVHSPGLTQTRHNTTSYASQSNENEKWATPVSNSDVYNNDVPTSTSSVRDLEEVMNKHLPSLPSEADALRSGLHAEFTSSSLGFQKQKSTIQWIGSHQHQHSSSAAGGVGTDTLPATHLLRTLYANRESVIRTNVYNPRPQYYGDITQTSLLTPPGSTTDPYKDMSPFSTPQVAPAAKTPPTTYSLMSGYSSNPISVAMAPNMGTVDAYGMTPPSSVSPQEKYASPFDQCHPDSARQYATLDGTSHTMPIKPQAYPLPAHANSHMAAAYDRTSQYTASGYYTPSAASFPTYNHAASPSPAHYRDSAKNGVGW